MTKQKSDTSLNPAGIQAAKEILESRGWTVEEKPGEEYDLLIQEMVTVKVLAANSHKPKCKRNIWWQFRLIEDGEKCHKFGPDLLIVICWGEEQCFFVIPGCVVSYRLETVDITRRNPGLYNGKYAEFREAWELGDYIIAGTLWMYEQSPQIPRP